MDEKRQIRGAFEIYANPTSILLPDDKGYKMEDIAKVRRAAVDSVLKLFAAAEARGAEKVLDPFDYVEPCEPDCTPTRHAYHHGQWDLATRIAATQQKGQDDGE